MSEGLLNTYDEWDAGRSTQPANRSQAERVSSVDPVRTYLNEISKTPLLDAEKEVELSKRIEAGLFAGKLLDAMADPDTVPQIDAPKVVESFIKSPHNQSQLTRDLRALSNDGEHAKNHMLEANLRLVVSLAKRYSGRGMTFLDLIQEGNVGLIRAVEKFDYTKGFKFSTYATWWIRQGITRAIADQGRMIRLPVHLQEEVNKVSRIRKRMMRELEREPEIEEILAEIGDEDMKPERLQELLEYDSGDAISYNQFVGDKHDSELADFIEDADAINPAETVVQNFMTSDVKAFLDARLGTDEKDVRARQVIEWRYGLDGSLPRTLDSIAQQFGLSREAVRQIERKALNKLRDSPPEDLKYYLQGIDSTTD